MQSANGEKGVTCLIVVAKIEAGDCNFHSSKLARIGIRFYVGFSM